MPYESEAERGWMHVHEPEIAKRWDKETPKGADLPEHVKKAKQLKAECLETFGKKLRAPSNVVQKIPYKGKEIQVVEQGDKFMAVVDGKLVSNSYPSKQTAIEDGHLYIDGLRSDTWG